MLNEIEDFIEPKKKKKMILLYLEENLKNEFFSHCAQRGTSMTKELIKLIKNDLGKD